MDAVTRPSHRRCAVAVGGLVRRVSECHRLQLQLQLVGGRRCVGGPVDGMAHVSATRREYRQPVESSHAARD